MSRIGELVRKYRQRRDLSQADLAERVRVDQKYISDIERGQTHGSVAVLLGIADELGVSRRKLRNAYWEDVTADAQRKFVPAPVRAEVTT